VTSLYYNEDSTNFFFHYDATGGRGGAALDSYLDLLSHAGITSLLCNTNAQRCNYNSDVWTPTWEGFDPGGADDQPYLAPLATEARAAWCRLATNMLALHEEGIDYPAHVIEGSRRRQMSPWITLRMNDVHDQDNLEHPIHGRFWREHPELWRAGSTSYFARAFDFAHAEVRAYFMDLVDETLERYDVDGLELDFLREPFLFSVGAEARGRQLLTDWVGQVRARIDAAARRRGHPVMLGVRAPSRPAVAEAFGLDPLAWARAGWLDLLVVSPRWSTIEFDMPIDEWRQQLSGCDLTLAGGLEILRGRHWTAPKRPVTAAEARGAAAQVLAGGADAVYLFNYFQSADAETIPDAWTRDAYAETITSLASLERITPLPRCHCVTFADMVGPESADAGVLQLPAQGTSLVFFLPTGPRPVDARALLRLDVTAQPAAVVPVIRVNDSAPLVLASDTPAGEIRQLTFDLPVNNLTDGTPNRITLGCEQALRVEGVDIDIHPH
jgi:hypothetical protein